MTGREHTQRLIPPSLADSSVTVAREARHTRFSGLRMALAWRRSVEDDPILVDDTLQPVLTPGIVGTTSSRCHLYPTAADCMARCLWMPNDREVS